MKIIEKGRDDLQKELKDQKNWFVHEIVIIETDKTPYQRKY